MREDGLKFIEITSECFTFLLILLKLFPQNCPRSFTLSISRFDRRNELGSFLLTIITISCFGNELVEFLLLSVTGSLYRFSSIVETDHRLLQRVGTIL